MSSGIAGTRPLLRSANGKGTLSGSDINKREYLRIEFVLRWPTTRRNLPSLLRSLCRRLGLHLFGVRQCCFYAYHHLCIVEALPSDVDIIIIIITTSCSKEETKQSECLFLQFAVAVSESETDGYARVRARAKSTCLVCKRTRDHHRVSH